MDPRAFLVAIACASVLAGCDTEARAPSSAGAVVSETAALVRCPFCGFHNEDGALFCEQCKSDLAIAPHPHAPLSVELPALPMNLVTVPEPAPETDRTPLPEPAPETDPPTAPAPPTEPTPTATACDADHVGGIKCPFCGFHNEEGALFCEQCKSDISAVCPTPVPDPTPTPVPDPTPTPVPDPAPCPAHGTGHIKCPFCGFDNEAGALFCEQCKSDISAACPAPAPTPSATPIPDE